MAESNGASVRPREPHELILRDIQDAVQGFEARAKYACGGAIPISTGGRNLGDYGATKGPVTSPPVILRWDTPNGITKKIQFPPIEGAQGRYTSTLNELIHDCTPASFGRQGKDVFDEAYGKAQKRE